MEVSYASDFHAIAVGATFLCCIISAKPAWAFAVGSEVDDGFHDEDDTSSLALTVQHAGQILPVDDDRPFSFSWANDPSLGPRPYVIAAEESDVIPLSVTSTAIPLPPGVWTGFAGLGALAAFPYLRRTLFRR